MAVYVKNRRKFPIVGHLAAKLKLRGEESGANDDFWYIRRILGPVFPPDIGRTHSLRPGMPLHTDAF